MSEPGRSWTILFDMSLLIVGTVAFDTVETPWGKAERVLGGSGTYAGFAASFFSTPRLVGVVGEDFPAQYLDLLVGRGVDIEGVQRVSGKSFFWAGRYEEDINIRTTLATELNVLETFEPVLPESYRDSRFVFLANIDPELQLSVLDQCDDVEFSIIDTMNFWIDGNRAALDRVLERVDAVLLNDEEARMLCGTPNLLKAARMVLEGNPKLVLIKKGEHGVMMVTEESVFMFPGYPLEHVCDPTGAGDSFAGGFIGYLAKTGRTDDETLRQAVVAGTTTASYCCEDFSVDRYGKLTLDELANRAGEFVALTSFKKLEL